MAIVAVQFFGLSRGFLRYEERLVGHDAAFRLLADLRVRVYERLERWRPPACPRSGAVTSWPAWSRTSTRYRTWSSGSFPPSASPCSSGRLDRRPAVVDAAGRRVILAVSLVLAPPSCRGSPGCWPGAASRGSPRVRGDLGAAMVDLTEGAAELIAFGAADAQLRTIRDQDARTDRHRLGLGRNRGIGLALTTLLAGLACWGCLMVGIPPCCRAGSTATELAVITLIPLAAFELVVGSAGGHPGAAAGPPGRGAGLRGDRHSGCPSPIRRWPVPLPEPPFDLEVRSVWAGYPGAPVPGAP